MTNTVIVECHAVEQGDEAIKVNQENLERRVNTVIEEHPEHNPHVGSGLREVVEEAELVMEKGRGEGEETSGGQDKLKVAVGAHHQRFANRG